jgi:hypothetical protein
MRHPIVVTPADTPSNEDEISHESDISGLDEEGTPGDTADEGIPAGRVAFCKRGTKRNAKSGIWKYFEVYQERTFAHLAFCKLCNSDINYTISMSTGMLTWHMSEYEEYLDKDMAKKLRNDADSDNSKVQLSLDSFVKHGPSFEKKSFSWIVQIYQPLSASIPLSEKCVNLLI